MPDLDLLKKDNADRWKAATITRDFSSVARRLLSAKARYVTVQEKTGVPWFIVAVIHERESAQNWMTNIAQGDPWDKVSVHVPAGRGPFDSWEDAAFDALTKCAPYAARNKDWSVGGSLTLLEQYNGLGYAKRGLPSPYIWSGTDQYEKGKYVADGKFDPEAVDKQLGCAGLLMKMQQFDTTIKFDDGQESTTQSDPPKEEPKPEGWLANVIDFAAEVAARATRG